MTTERCLIRALLIMSAICAVCSRVPDRLGVKPFCMLCSTKLLDARKEYTAFRRQDVNTFKGIWIRVLWGGNLKGHYCCLSCGLVWYMLFSTQLGQFQIAKYRELAQ